MPILTRSKPVLCSGLASRHLRACVVYFAYPNNHQCLRLNVYSSKKAAGRLKTSSPICPSLTTTTSAFLEEKSTELHPLLRRRNTGINNEIDGAKVIALGAILVRHRGQQGSVSVRVSPAKALGAMQEDLPAMITSTLSDYIDGLCSMSRIVSPTVSIDNNHAVYQPRMRHEEELGYKINHSLAGFHGI